MNAVNLVRRNLSLHLMVGVALGLTIFGGFKLGTKMDELVNSYPAFTIIEVLIGIVIGGLAAYVMIYNYFGSHSKKLLNKSKAVSKMRRNEDTEWPVIEAALDDIHDPIRCFANDGLITHLKPNHKQIGG